MSNDPKRHVDLKAYRQEQQQDEQGRTNRRGHVLTGVNYKSIVDQLIEEAQERGDFDDLAGTGKPLNLDENHFAGDMQLAYKMLKDNDFTLPWIADRNDLLDEITKLRAKIKHQWALFGPQVVAMARGGQMPMAKRRWTALTAQWQVSIEMLNRRIQDVNFSIPVRRLEIVKLGIEAELTRIGVGRSLEETIEQSDV